MGKKIFKIAIIGVAIICLIVIGLISWQSNSIINDMARTRVVDNNGGLIQKFSSHIDRVETENSDGFKVSAWRFAIENPKGIVIVIHGMHGQDASSLLDFGYFFKKANYETFCIDLRSHGRSQGNRIGFGYTEVADLTALLDWIKTKDKYQNKDIILYGISMGGATAINTAAERDDISGVISVSAFQSYEQTFVENLERAQLPKFVINTYKPIIRFLLLTKYKMNPVKNSPLHKISQINDKPVLIVHGDADQQITVDQAYQLKENAGDNAELWVVKDHGHMVVTDILNPENEWYGNRILNFIDSNLN